MVALLRATVSKLARTAPFGRPAGPRGRGRLGYYGYRYRRPQRRSAAIALGVIAAAMAIATLAAASWQVGR